ncbi:hypothetical protein KBI52_00045, partial [Microvirga sp. HBU67558]|nr:hypothetical protein [Microvirga sp. HBU67558]
MMRHLGKRAPASLGSILFWIIASLITLLPIYWMFAVSAKSRVQLFGSPSFLISSFFTENYTSTLSDPA